MSFQPWKKPAPTKFCWNCRNRKTAVHLSPRLSEAVSRVHEKGANDLEAVVQLIREVSDLAKEKHKCAKEPHAWVHLLDLACALWQPRGTRVGTVELSSSHEGLKKECCFI